MVSYQTRYPRFTASVVTKGAYISRVSMLRVRNKKKSKFIILPANGRRGRGSDSCGGGASEQEAQGQPRG